MKLKLKNISEQVIVITGASSGIGLATARMAAERGARLVLAARSQDALRQLVDEIRRTGGQAVSVTADISKREGAQQIMRVARDSYGGFDTWVNNAGIGMYGRSTPKIICVRNRSTRRRSMRRKSLREPFCIAPSIRCAMSSRAAAANTSR